MQYWGKTIRQVRGLGRAKKVAQDVELNANANDDPVLNDPAVRDQLRAQGKVDYKVHLCLELGAQPLELCLTLSLYSSIFSKPLFLLAVTLAQLGMMAAELVVNQGFEPPAQNVLFVNICSTPPKQQQQQNTVPSLLLVQGPSQFTLLKLGAKYAPCMRPNATQYAATPLIPCGSEYPASNGTMVNGTCMVDYYAYYSYFCGMGGFTVPNQGWRFFTPMFLHTGLIELAFTVVFQVRSFLFFGKNLFVTTSSTYRKPPMDQRFGRDSQSSEI